MTRQWALFLNSLLRARLLTLASKCWVGDETKLGYESVKLLDNSGIFVLTWVILALIALISLLLKLMFKKCKCVQRCSSRVLKGIVWNPVIRTLIETFLELGLCSFVNVLHVIGF